jgi:hypothetical protein
MPFSKPRRAQPTLVEFVRDLNDEVHRHRLAILRCGAKLPLRNGFDSFLVQNLAQGSLNRWIFHQPVFFHSDL